MAAPPRTGALFLREKLICLGIGQGLVALAFLFWAAGFMRAEHTLYGWDFLGLWNKSADLAQSIHHGLFAALAELGKSMHHEYNDASGVPSALAMALFGPSRIVYVLSVATLIVVPAAIGGVLLFVRWDALTWQRVAFLVLACVGALLVPVPWMVTLSGMTDVAGLLAAFVALDLVIRTDRSCRDVWRWLALGAVLGITALLKRWYLFWIVCLLAIFFLERAWLLVEQARKRSLTFTSLVAVALPLVLIGASLVAVYALSLPLPLKLLRTDYSHAFIAYQQADGLLPAIALNFKEVAEGYGPAAILFSAACFIFGLCLPQARRAVMYLFVPSCLALVYFSHVQTMEVHHLLLLYFAIVLTPLFLAGRLLSSKLAKERGWAWGILLVFVTLHGLGFRSVFAASPPFGDSFVQRALPSARVQPQQRQDFAQIEALMDYVGGLVARPGTASAEDVYLISSSYFFNASDLSSLDFQLQKPIPAASHICWTHDVDARQGFPDELLTVPLVLVAAPVQTHLYREQKVVTVPAREFLQGGVFAQAFQRLPPVFHLDNGIDVYVYERTRPSTPAEIAELRQAVGVPSMPGQAQTQ